MCVTLQKESLCGACVFLCLLAIQPSLEAATFHVAQNEPGAADDNDGLAPKLASAHRGPWKSFAKAAAVASAGDTVLIYDGDYRQDGSQEGAGRISIDHSGASAAEPIIFAAAPEQKPVMKTFLVHDRQWIVIRGFHFVNPDYAFPKSWKDMPETVVEEPAIKIDPREAWATREVKVNQKYATFAGILGDFEAAQSIGIDIKHSSDIRVEGNTVSGYTRGVRVRDRSTNVVIEGNRLTHCRDGVFTWEPKPSLTGGVIRNNVIYQNLSTGIFIREDACNVLIENNHLEYNGICHISAVHGSRDCTVRGNVAQYGGYYSEVMRNPGGSAINIHSSHGGMVVERNLAAYQVDPTGNDGNGFIADMMLDGAGVLFRNNVSYRNMGGGFATTESPHCQFLNNTAVENGYHGVNPRSGAGIRLCRKRDVDNTALNNIFCNNGAGGITSSEAIARQTLVDHNLYYATNGAPLIRDAQRAYKTVDEIRENTPCERHGRLGDPSFSNPQQQDFHLRPDSPAIAAGQFLPDVVDDFDGQRRPQGASCAAGAFEFHENRP